MKFNTKIGAVLLAFLLGLMVVTGLGGAVVSAQTQTMTLVQPTAAQVCFTPAGNLRFGAVDYSSGGGVSQLQSFLNTEGYFDASYLGSGRYGTITMRAVAKFQAANGLPATGYFGPLTRALVQQKCGTVVVPPTQSINIWSANPTSGVVGATVTLTGVGFTATNNTVLMDGSVAAQNVTATTYSECPQGAQCFVAPHQTITFTIPSSLAPNCATGMMCAMYMRMVTPATYTITVQNSNGTSNAVKFTVTDNTTTNNQVISITGLDTPASLALGQAGTWTVHVNTPTSNSSLHYSVVWGDEAPTMGTNIMASKMATVQSTGTFTHSYSHSGNYTPVFTVSDDSGHSVSASNTVVVTPLY